MGSSRMMSVAPRIRYPEWKREYVLEVLGQDDLPVVVDAPDLEALPGSGKEVRLVPSLPSHKSTSSGMNMSLVGGYSCWKVSRRSRAFWSLSWMIST